MRYRLLAIAAALWLIHAPVLAQGLQDAVRERDRPRIERLLAQDGTDVNARDALGSTALHWAAFHGDSALAERLLARGARVDVRVTNGNTPLHQAAYAGHAQTVELLVARGADINARDARGNTPLHWAARNGHEETVGVLVAAGASRDTRAGDGTPPLSASRLLNRKRVVRTLNNATPAPVRPAANRSHQAPAPGDDVRPESTSPPPAPTETGRYRVQVGVRKDETGARQAWTRLQRGHGHLLGQLDLFLDRVPRSGGGLWYRIRTQLLDEASARRLCEALKARRVDCLVARKL